MELQESLQNTNISNKTEMKSRKPSQNDDADDEEKNYDFRVLYFAFFAIYLGRTLILPLLPSYANSIWQETTQQDKLPDDKQGLLAALFYVTYAIAGVSFGPTSMRIGRKPTLLICIIGITFGFIGQAMSNSYWCLVATRAGSGFFAAINGLCQSYISDIAKPHLVPKYTARLGTVFGLVFGLGPLFGGLVAKLNGIILEQIFIDDFPSSLKYQCSLFFGAAITGIATFIVIFKLKESLPPELRISWTKKKIKKNKLQIQTGAIINNNQQKEGPIQNETTQTKTEQNVVEVLSIIPHPDYDDVSKLILNIFDLKKENKIIKQIRFNMKQFEATEPVTDELLEACNLDEIYKHDIINSINESRYIIDSIPENKTDDLSLVNTANIPSISSNNGEFIENTINIDFERDIDFIDYDTYHHSDKHQNEINDDTLSELKMEQGIDFAALYEAMLPERERSPKFKARLKKYMIIILFITIIMDIATAGHATILALLNNGTNLEEGLNWKDDLIFSITWMAYGVSYSGIQFFYVALQKRYGVFITGAIGCFIKVIGCVLIPLSTNLCRYIELNQAWIELLIHLPASIFNGIGYGLCNTTTQTVISDYAKRYNIRSVGNWLGCWMAAVALGAAGVILLGTMSQKIGCISTFYFCALLAMIAFMIFIYLAIVARDIKIMVDIKQVVNDNQILGDKLERLVHDEIEKSISKASILSPAIAPLTPNLPRISSNFMRRHRNSTASYMTSDDRLTTAGSLARNVTESITKLSLTQSLSSFNVSTPFGPLPIAPPSQLIGVPMISSKIFDQKNIHIDLKNNTEINISTLTPRSSMKSLDLDISQNQAKDCK